MREYEHTALPMTLLERGHARYPLYTTQDTGRAAPVTNACHPCSMYVSWHVRNGGASVCKSQRQTGDHVLSQVLSLAKQAVNDTASSSQVTHKDELQAYFLSCLRWPSARLCRKFLMPDDRHISYKRKLREYDGGPGEWLGDSAITSEPLEGAYYYANTLGKSSFGSLRTIVDMKRRRSWFCKVMSKAEVATCSAVEQEALIQRLRKVSPARSRQ